MEAPLAQHRADLHRVLVEQLPADVVVRTAGRRVAPPGDATRKT
ncbi:hypothetical protein [Lentzea xinjiangensis]|nr:hypothetical protein [Lentzea xinjiangensis]